MADKSWLIRTKNRQILGPATKQKVIELLEKGSLSGEDEVTCGNGYWFWVRERDLIEKYLYGDLPQSFNPISEAQDVLTSKSSADGITASMTATPIARPSSKENKQQQIETNLPENDELAYPDEGDLDYPDMGSVSAPETPVRIPVTQSSPPAAITTPKVPANIQVGTVEYSEGDDNTLFPEGEDLEYPSLEEIGSDSLENSLVEDCDPNSTAEIESLTLQAARESVDDDITDPNIQIPKFEEDPEESLEEVQEYVEDIRPKKRRKKRVAKSGGNDRYLIYIGALLFIIIGVVIYYFKVIINKPIPYIGISSVHAQTISSLSKKKT